MMGRRRLLVAIFLGIAALLAVGVAVISSIGPLKFSTSSVDVCGDSQLYPTASVGIEIPSNLASDITINKVTLVGAENMKLDGTSVLKYANDNGNLRVLFGTFPPADKPSRVWKTAVPAVGAVVSPGDFTDLVLKLDSGPDFPAKAAGVLIDYTAYGWHYSAEAKAGIKVAEIADC